MPQLLARIRPVVKQRCALIKELANAKSIALEGVTHLKRFCIWIYVYWPDNLIMQLNYHADISIQFRFGYLRICLFFFSFYLFIF